MSRDEVARRLVHAGGAVFPGLYLLGVLSWGDLRVVYLAGSALAVALEFFRLVVGMDWWVYRRLTREYEASNPAGYALYAVSSMAVVEAFEPRIAVPAVLMLAVADPVSGLLSATAPGQTKRPAVLAVTFGLCLALAAPFVSPVAAVAGAAAATAADGLTPVIRGYVLDDNLTIPIGAAVVMWVGVEWVPAIL